jgi:hypothetical protein
MIPSNCRKYSLGGAYRKISMLPSHVSWKIAQYDDATLPLVASDIELIEKKEIISCKGVFYKHHLLIYHGLIMSYII